MGGVKRESGEISAIRRRDEFAVIAGRQPKAAMRPVAGAPGLFGGLDAVFRRGHEVPPDVARAAGPREEEAQMKTGYPLKDTPRSLIGGVDGARTRDPRRDRPVF